MTAYAANLRALAALANAQPDATALRSYTGWTDPRTRAEAFDAVGTPQPAVSEAYARLSLRPDFTRTGDRNRAAESLTVVLPGRSVGLRGGL